MTQKVEDKLAELTDIVKKIKTESDNRVVQLSNLLDAMKTDVAGIKQSQDESGVKTGSLNNEIQLAETGITDEKKSIEGLKAKLTTLTPELETNKQVFTNLESEITNLTSKNSELDTNISDQEAEKQKLLVEQTEKSEALASLEASIDKDLESYKAELGQVKAELNKIIDNNQVWDYMFEIIETPEVEIMAIIAANRNISLDDIKGKTTVSPVFVGRAISKLEADGKIVNKDDVWDLSTSVLNAIQS